MLISLRRAHDGHGELTTRQPVHHRTDMSTDATDAGTHDDHEPDSLPCTVVNGHRPLSLLATCCYRLPRSEERRVGKSVDLGGRRGGGRKTRRTGGVRDTETES